MAIYFFDSSALVKRYINERGSQWVNDTLDPQTGNRIYIASIAGVEVVSSISRRGRQGSITSSDVQLALQQFQSDYLALFRHVTLSGNVLRVAMNWAEIHFLRGYDAVQLASALVIQSECAALQLPSLIFVSSDLELNSTAGNAGLLVEDPNTYP